MQQAGMPMHDAAAPASAPVPMLTDAQWLPLAGDPACGTVLLNGGGTWIGHVGPGLVFLFWGLWWTLNIFLGYFRRTSIGKSYCCCACYPSPWRHAGLLRYVKHWEAITMIWGPLLMVWIELKGDHTAYTNMLCDNGRFDPRHLHNWQHTASYPAFVVTGIVHLLSNLISLPEGTQHSFLGLAFSIEGALMLLHKKHHPLDAILHWLLGTTMLSSAAFIFLEIRAPHNVVLSSAKAGSVMLTGVWLCVLGKMLFTDARDFLWAQDNMASSMMAPAVFAMLLLAVAVFQLLMFVVMGAVYKHCRRSKAAYAPLPVVLSPGKEAPIKLDAAALTRHTRSSSADDSAHEPSDAGSEASHAHGHIGSSSVAAGSSPVQLQSKQPNAVREVLTVLAKPVKGTLGAGPLRMPSSNKAKSDHVV